MNFGPILLLVGAGVLYYAYSNSQSAADAAAPQSSTAAPPPAPNTKQLVADAAARAGSPAGTLLNGDQWNYYYAQVRGVPGPAPDGIWPDRPRDFRMTIDEWWAGVSKTGLTGFRIAPGYARRIGR